VRKDSKLIKQEYVMKSNYIKYYLQQIFYNCVVILINGSVIQTFLMEYGVSGERVAMYVSVLQIVQVAVMLGVSGVVENLKNIIKASAWLTFAKVILVLALLFFSVMNSINVNVAFYTIFAVSILTHMCFGVTNVLAYKLPYHIIDIHDYGKVTSISGIMIGICGSLFSALIMHCTKYYDYFRVMALIYSAGAVMMLISLLLGLSFKPMPVNEKTDEKEKVNIFKYKPFVALSVPNILRGFCSGIFGVAAVVGYHYKILDSTSANALAVLLQISTVIGCFVYSLFSRKNKEGLIILLASIGTAICMPLMLFGYSGKVFLIVYLIGNFILNFINYAVPVAVTKIVEYRYMGQYSAWRMLFHTFGTAIGGASVTFMLNTFGGVPTMIIGGGCQLISGISYYAYMKCLKK